MKPQLKLKTSTNKRLTQSDIKQTATMVEVQSFRGGSPEKYAKWLKAIATKTCGNSPASRWKSCTEKGIAQTSDLVPIKCLDTPAGMCETLATCYYAAPKQGAETRERLYTDKEYADAVTAVNDYGKGIGMLLFGPFFMAVLVILVFIFWCIFRCFCNRCCGGRSGKPEGYAWKDKCPSVVVLCLFIFGILVCMATAKSANSNITDGINLTFKTAEDCTNDMMSFVMNGLAPLQAIIVTVSGAVTDIGSNLSEEKTAFVKTGLTDMADQMGAFGKLYGKDRAWPKNCKSDSNVVLKGLQQVLGVCMMSAPGLDTLGKSVKTATSGFRKTLEPVTKSLTSTLDLMQTSLVKGQKSMTDMIVKQINLTDTMRTKTVPGLTKSIRDFKKTSDSTNEIRLGGVLAIFAMKLVLCILALLGVAAHFTTCKYDDWLVYLLHFTWIFGTILCFLGFLLAGVLCTISVVLNDSCNFLAIASQDWSPYVYPASNSKMMNACFNNTNLVETFNMSARLDFTSAMSTQFAEIDNMDMGGVFGNATGPIAAVSKQVGGFSATSVLQYNKTVVGGTTLPTAVSALKKLNDATADSGNCFGPFGGNGDTKYTVGNVDQPWTANSMAPYVCGVSLTAEACATQYVKARYTASAPPTAACAAASQLITGTLYPIAYLFGVSARNGFGKGNAASANVFFDNMGGDFGEKGSAKATTYGRSSLAAAERYGYKRSVMQQSAAFGKNLTGLQTGIQRVANQTIKGAIGHIEDLKCQARCGWTLPCYFNMYTAICQHWLRGVGKLAIAILCASFFMIPIIITALILVKRMAAKHSGGTMVEYLKGKEGCLVPVGCEAGYCACKRAKKTAPELQEAEMLDSGRIDYAVADQPAAGYGDDGAVADQPAAGYGYDGAVAVQADPGYPGTPGTYDGQTTEPQEGGFGQPEPPPNIQAAGQGQY